MTISSCKMELPVVCHTWTPPPPICKPPPPRENRSTPTVAASLQGARREAPPPPSESTVRRGNPTPSIKRPVHQSAAWTPQGPPAGCPRRRQSARR
ncbi:hypothetical protein ACOMHN_049725 [Nucella lapillus]